MSKNNTVVIIKSVLMWIISRQNTINTWFDIINIKSRLQLQISSTHTRDGSRAAATSKMECFVTIVNGFQPLTIITKYSILDVAAVLDPPLHTVYILQKKPNLFDSLSKSFSKKSKLHSCLSTFLWFYRLFSSQFYFFSV